MTDDLAPGAGGRIALAVAFSALLGVTASPLSAGAALPTNFVVDQTLSYVFAGDPVGFTFLPDGRTILIARSPAVVYVGAVGNLIPALRLTIPNVATIGAEQGLLGVAVDPGWPTRPYIYFCYTHTSGFVYVTMYTVSGDLTVPSSTNLAFASPYHVLTDIPDAQDHHNAGTLRFAGSSFLFVSTGDDGDPCGPQDLSKLNGKILRLTVANLPGIGSGPPPKADITPAGNPFAGPNENARLIYAWGFRNPFRFTVDTLTNDLFVADVGEDSQEEVDRVFASAPGSNFGWPQREGELDHTCCGGCGSGNVYTAPIYTYPHSGFGNSIIGGPRMRFVGGQPLSFPANYDGNVFLTDLYEGWIRRLVLTGTTWAIAPAVPGQPSTTNWAEDFPFLSDLQCGPDGALYFCRMNGGPDRGVHRIRPFSVVDVPGVEAAATSRLQVWPNPMGLGGAASIAYALPVGATGALDLLDARGRMLRTWTVNGGAPGSLAWDGTSAQGAALPSGVYFVRLTGSRVTPQTEKITVVR